MPEAENFHEYSKQIVKDFIQNVVIIDDQILQENKDKITVSEIEKINLSVLNELTINQLSSAESQKNDIRDSDNEKSHNIDVSNLIDAFIKEGILCTSISPNISKVGFTTEEEKKRKAHELFTILSKADIVILDWQMYDDDKDGELTCELLKLFEKESDKLRLVIIYTGTNVKDNIIPKISEIFAYHPDKVNQIFTKNNSCFKHYNGLITKIVLKDNPAVDAGNLMIEKVSESNLPQLCLEEFTKTAEGLIFNSAFSAITDIRRNTQKILSSLKKDFDAPFINHRMRLPIPNDASFFLAELIQERILGSINIDKLQNTVSDRNIEKWFNFYGFDENINILEGVKNLNCLEVIQKGLDHVIDNNFCESEAKIIKEKLELQKHHSLTKHFNNIAKFNPNKIDKEFTSLSTTRNTYYSEEYRPHLTLGSVIKTNEQDCKYYLCLQPRCDSVRVDNTCSFILLPIFITNHEKNPQLCIYDKDKKEAILLKYGKVNTIVLKSFKKEYLTDDRITFNYIDGKYCIESNEEENNKYIWVSELKFTYAQKIVQDFANKICRIGLDEYEWFRKLQKS